MAYYQLEPFGSPADDDRFRTFCTLFYSANSKAGADIPMFFDRDPPPPIELDGEDDIVAFFAAMGAVAEVE